VVRCPLRLFHQVVGTVWIRLSARFGRVEKGAASGHARPYRSRWLEVVALKVYEDADEPPELQGTDTDGLRKRLPGSLARI
jgi:hypothetical protein